MTHYARKQTKDLAKQKQTASFWEVVGLDEDDVVSKGYIEAYNCLRESHHTVKMVGVPKDGDRVTFIIFCSNIYYYYYSGSFQEEEQHPS